MVSFFVSQTSFLKSLYIKPDPFYHPHAGRETERDSVGGRDFGSFVVWHHVDDFDRGRAVIEDGHLKDMTVVFRVLHTIYA